MSSGVDFRIGMASWTDPTLVKSDLFYPPSVKTAEDRLRFYAERFNTVEVDSTYYALPAERNAELWADRTPPDFLFNIKAFALMTQHPAEVSRLPKNLREMLSPSGQLALGIFAALAEFEHELRVERARVGMAQREPVDARAAIATS